MQTPDSTRAGQAAEVERGPGAPPLHTAPPVDADGLRTSPDHDNPNFPPGVPYIVGNEACERFSYYGMKAILFQHLTTLYATAIGLGAAFETMSEEAKKALPVNPEKLATGVTHLFNAGVYALPMIGAILADRLIGKYRTIFWLSLVYCAGHGVLALADAFSLAQTKLYCFYVGLALIAIGSGGIKPCVSANVGDQFGRANMNKIGTVYQLFYFSINFGSFFSTILIPILLARYGPGLAFGLPGILMFLATVIFWMGRRKYVHIPPTPGGEIGLLDTLASTFLFLSVGHLFFTKSLEWYILVPISLAFLAIGLWLFLMRQKKKPDDGFLAIMVHTLGSHFSGKKAPPAEGWSSFWWPAVERYGAKATEGPVAVLKIIAIFFFVSVFWALFDQHSSTWVKQAGEMDLTFLSGSSLAWFNQTFGSEWDGKLLKTQIGAANPLMVMALIPLLNLVYAWCRQMGVEPTPLRRITVGMFLTAASFVGSALIQQWIDSQGKGTVPIAWQLLPYLIITIGEVLVSITGLEFAYTQAPVRMKSTIMGFWLLTVSLGNVLVAFLATFKDLSSASFFWVCAGLMAAASLIFGVQALFYVPKSYAQE